MCVPWNGSSKADDSEFLRVGSGRVEGQGFFASDPSGEVADGFKVYIIESVLFCHCFELIDDHFKCLATPHSGSEAVSNPGETLVGAVVEISGLIFHIRFEGFDEICVILFVADCRHDQQEDYEFPQH